jgi:hypothetical protein
MSISKTQVKDSEVFRRNIQQKIGELFVSLETNSEKMNAIAINIEKGIYNFSIRESKLKKILCKWEYQPFVLIYIARLRSVLWNLESNLELRQMIHSGEITMDMLSKNKGYQIYFWSTEEERLMKQEDKKNCLLR